jgi:sporulation protein YunB
MKGKTKFKIFFSLIILAAAFNFFIYVFDRIIAPTVLAVADAEMRARALEIINMCIIEEFSRDFDYDEIIRIEKDLDGNITMLKADTLKMNMIACNVALRSQKKLEEMGSVGIKLPMGYVFRNNILAYYGPRITVRMQPIGYIEALYLSEFNSAGINQTNHKIYVQVKTKVRVIIPLKNNEIEVKNQIPISETIIVGKTPETAINFDMSNAGFKLPNKN